jgi:crossover junction endodeoxyribonuclease RusA
MRAVAMLRNAMVAAKCVRIDGPVRIEATFAMPPDNRKRDTNNYAKALLDACTKAGVWKDDDQVEDERYIKAKAEPGHDGTVTITVWEMHK